MHGFPIYAQLAGNGACKAPSIFRKETTRIHAFDFLMLCARPFTAALLNRESSSLAPRVVRQPPDSSPNPIFSNIR
jgi:hypothetical protein